jgi:hypothetical protein
MLICVCCIGVIMDAQSLRSIRRMAALLPISDPIKEKALLIKM